MGFHDYLLINKNCSCRFSECLDNSTALVVFLCICENMEGNMLVCTYDFLSEFLGVSVRTITRSVRFLVEHGFLSVEHSGKGNVYRVNPDLIRDSQYFEVNGDVQE